MQSWNLPNIAWRGAHALKSYKGMQKGPSVRKPHTQKRYIHERRGLKDCPFCTLDCGAHNTIYEETTFFYHIENIFPYDAWDNHIVTDHQLIVPKRHIISLAQFSDEEGLEYLTIIKRAEAKGYNIYARAEGSTSRSVAHQHTHLIKIDNNQVIDRLFYLQQPHALFFHTKHK